MRLQNLPVHENMAHYQIRSCLTTSLVAFNSSGPLDQKKKEQKRRSPDRVVQRKSASHY